MITKTGPSGSADKHVKEIKRKTRRQFSAEEKIRIVLKGLRGEDSIAELARIRPSACIRQCLKLYQELAHKKGALHCG